MTLYIPVYVQASKGVVDLFEGHFLEFSVGGRFHRFYEVEKRSAVEEGEGDIETWWEVQDVLVEKFSVGEGPSEIRDVYDPRIHV